MSVTRGDCSVALHRACALGLRAICGSLHHRTVRQEDAMQLGMIGLGRMGANMVRRLSRHGHDCVVFDADPARVKELQDEGATGVDSITGLVA